MNDSCEQQDHYVHRLAEVNKTNGVCTTEDIRNTQGAMIVAKGTPITLEISQKIVKHKLLMPLEACVTLEQSITPEILLDELNKIIAEQENNQILEQDSLQQLLNSSCQALSDYPLLVQKITVMEDRFPDIFRKTLGSSFIALIIAWQMELSDTECQQTFIAAIMRDMGLLHIDPALSNSNPSKIDDKLSPQELRTLQGHVVIGKIFLDLVPKLPKVIGLAVLEHHERSDGSGYPHGKAQAQLCQIGQVLAMADTVVGIYDKQVKHKSFTLAAVIPILQINIRLFPLPIYKAMISTLRLMSAPMQRRYPDANIPALCTEISHRIEHLAQWQQGAEALSLDCVKALPSSKTRILKGVALRIRHTIITSGLLTHLNAQWLKCVAEEQNPEDFLEVEQQLLMMDELEWHCQQWHLRLGMCFDDNDNDDWAERHRELSDMLEDEASERLVA